MLLVDIQLLRKKGREEKKEEREELRVLRHLSVSFPGTRRKNLSMMSQDHMQDQW